MVSKKLVIKALRRLADNLEDKDHKIKSTYYSFTEFHRRNYIQSQIRDDLRIVEDLIDEIHPRITSAKLMIDFANQDRKE